MQPKGRRSSQPPPTRAAFHKRTTLRLIASPPTEGSPVSALPPPPPPSTNGSSNERRGLAWAGRHKIVTVVAILLVLGVAGSAMGAEDPAADDTAASTSAALAPSTPAPAPVSPTPTTVKVPDVVGLSAAKATEKLEAASLTVNVSRKYSHEKAGIVLGVTPEPGAHVDEGASLTIVVARAFPRVPNVIGLNLTKATAKLKSAGYKVSVTKQTSSQGTGTVLSMKPGGGSQLLPGQSVVLVVAKPAPAPPSTPPPTNCTKGYSPCLPPASDYDCAGGSGEGPEYLYGTVQVTGSDPYGLDSDNDGLGCE
jgi:hypothetical protein